MPEPTCGMIGMIASVEALGLVKLTVPAPAPVPAAVVNVNELAVGAGEAATVSPDGMPGPVRPPTNVTPRSPTAAVAGSADRHRTAGGRRRRLPRHR